MGNISSRNDHYPVPPGFMPPVYPGYPQFPTPTSWNPFKRSQLKKREKALRDYLYTTPMILQYPGSFAVTQPGQNLVQPGIPQVHAAIPINANGQMQAPFSAPVIATGAGAGAGALPARGVASAPVIPSQMMSMNYPATYDYSNFLDPRDDTEPVRPRRSRRSQRHHRSHHRSRRRSPTPSTGSSGSDTEYSSPGSYDSADYHRHHRSNSGHNPLPRPPKDVLSSTPFRPILTQLPSAQYNPWGLGGTSNLVPQQQPQPQPTTYGNVRPRRERERRERRGDRSRGGRGQFPVPSLAAAANAFIRPFTGQGQTMSMPEPHPAQPPPGGTSHPPGTPGHRPVIPQMHSPQPPQMRMPTPDHHVMNQGPPVIPQGNGMGNGMPMPMPSPGPAGHTPFVGPVGPGGLGTPRTPMRTPGPSMPMPVVPSPRSGHVPMPSPMNGGATMPMPSPATAPGGFAQSPRAGIPPPGNMMVTGLMAMPSPSLGAGMVPQGQQILKFNGYGEFAGLLYHSPHTVLYQEELYPTALHLFEARKFLDHRPDLADRIRECERVEDVTSISADMAEFTRRDWSNVALITMDEVLYLKFRQHSDLRTLLLNTYPAELVYVESGDPFWGDGAGSGMNELGKSLMRVRERLREEVNM